MRVETLMLFSVYAPVIRVMPEHQRLTKIFVECKKKEVTNTGWGDLPFQSVGWNDWTF